MVRPTGVTVIAVLCFLGTALCALFGLLTIVGGGFVATLINQQGAQGSAGVAGIMAGLGAALGVFMLIIAAVNGVIGFGLWKLKEWARIVTIILCGISALFQVLGLLGSMAHFNPIAFAWSGFWLGIDALIIWYLLKPEVKAAFQPPMARTASA